MPAFLHVGGYAKLTPKYLQDAFYKEHGLTRDSIGLLEQTYASNGNQTYEVRFSAGCCIPIASFKLEPTATPPPLPNLLQRLAVGQHVTLSQGVDAGCMEFYAKHGVTWRSTGVVHEILTKEENGTVSYHVLFSPPIVPDACLLPMPYFNLTAVAPPAPPAAASPLSDPTAAQCGAGGQASPLSELGAMSAGLTEASSTPPIVPTSSRLAAIPRDDGALSAITGVMDAPLLDLFTAAGRTGVPDVDAHAFMALEKAEELQANGQLGGLTIDEAAAIALYTAECNFYSTLNGLLSQRDRLALAPFLPFLRLMLQARRKLPTHTQAVWRGVKGVDLTSDFPKGKKLFWWTFTSTSKNVSTLLNPAFCGTSGTRTQFMIEASSGVDIVRMQRRLQPWRFVALPMSLLSPF
jgi:hypothetical protein